MIYLKAGAVGLIVCLAAQASAQECTTEFEAQSLAYIADATMIAKEMRRIRARLDSQDMRLRELGGAAGLDRIPAAPELPEVPSSALADGKGCTQSVDEDLAKLATVREDLDRITKLIAERDAAITSVEAGDVPDAPVAEETPVVEVAPEPAAPEAPREVAAAEPEAEPPAPEVATVIEAPRADVVAPLTVPNNPDLYQRILSLPDLQLFQSPGVTEGGNALPVFSVLYVFERRDVGGQNWLYVGDSMITGPSGWVPADKAIDWSTMLVMQFAPRGKRNRVLFFGDQGPLSDIVSGPFHQTESLDIYRVLEDERRKVAADAAHKPQWNRDLVAVEPETAVRYDDKPYLLPILDWRSEMFDGTTDTTLVKVAALPAQPSIEIGARDTASMTASAADAAANDDEFRVGIVFVVDTTISMRPFIDHTYAAIEKFQDEFRKYESARYVTFGLMGFRDTIETDPERLEYVTRNFQPLDAEMAPDSLLRNMRQISEAPVSNLGFEEDAFAGVMDAIDENDWSPFDARLIVLVTDASARVGDHAKYPDLTVEQLREKARSQNIAIVPIHLLTPANAGDEAARGRSQFEKLAQTGDLASNKYLALDASTDETFARELDAMASTIASNTMSANAGQVVRDPLQTMEPVPEPAPDEGRLSEVVGNELFRAQLESLGRVEGSAAPAFLAGWAADRDMTNPEVETLEVSVYLTRNQLSTLDKRLGDVISAFRSGGQDPQAFFANLQMLAAETSTDPDQLRQGDRATIEAILPSFLAALPYRSQVLRLDQPYWSALSVSQQQEFVEALEAKRKIYADIFGQTEIWADFGSGDPGLQATPVRLTNLP